MPTTPARKSQKTSRQKLTPPQLAKQWGISDRKVLDWIESGELRAINAATRPDGRPRYLIDGRDVEAFERRRAVNPQGIEDVHEYA